MVLHKYYISYFHMIHLFYDDFRVILLVIFLFNTLQLIKNIHILYKLLFNTVLKKRIGTLSTR